MLVLGAGLSLGRDETEGEELALRVSETLGARGVDGSDGAELSLD